MEGLSVALRCAAANAAFNFEFVACYCTVAADLSCSQDECCISEDVRCEDVDEAHDEDCDSAADDEAPECHAEGLLGRIRLVEVCEDAVAEEDLGCAEHDEAGLGAKEWPVAAEVGFEKWCFC